MKLPLRVYFGTVLAFILISGFFGRTDVNEQPLHKTVHHIFSSAGLGRSGLNPKSVVVKNSLFINSLEDLPHNASKWPVIVMTTKGRLANGLFQYALGYIAKEVFPDAVVGVTSKVDSFARKVLEPDCLILPVIGDKFLKENSFMVEMKEPDYMNGELMAYFLPYIENSVKGFRVNKTMGIILMEAFDYGTLYSHKDLVKRRMKILQHNLDKADDYINRVLKERFGEADLQRKNEIVSFHIRRRDFLLYSALFHKHSLPDKAYYARALNFYRKKLFQPTFIVCTDDVEHATQALKELERDSDIVIKGEGTEGEDIALMASCQHFILTVGTFGFMPAFLAGGQVVYPLFSNMKPSRFAKDKSIPTWKVVNYKEHHFKGYYGLLA